MKNDCRWIVLLGCRGWVLLFVGLRLGFGFGLFGGLFGLAVCSSILGIGVCILYGSIVKEGLAYWSAP